MRFKSLATLLIVFLSAAPMTVKACVCERTISLAESKMVFQGKVIAKSRWQRSDKSAEELNLAADAFDRYIFSVRKTLKGRSTKTVVVDAPIHNCGARFEVDNSYEVYLVDASDQFAPLLAYSCSKTRPLMNVKRQKR
jgi:hypothetical protein